MTRIEKDLAEIDRALAVCERQLDECPAHAHLRAASILNNISRLRRDRSATARAVQIDLELSGSSL